MSLYSFHRFLITTGIVFCLGFAAWELAEYRAIGDGWALVVGIGSGVAGLAFAYYLRHLNRFLGIAGRGGGPGGRYFSPNGHQTPESEPALDLPEEL